MTLKGWLREPLVHFLIAGAALFLIGGWLAPPPQDDLLITVGREEMRDHLQARTQVYDDDQFDQLLERLSEEERAELVREIAITEALRREGEALRLSENDPLVRQRVIQQMRQLLLEQSASGLTVSEEEVEQFYQDNQARYALGQSVSFSHLFFAGPQGEARAGAALAAIGKGADSGALGDRFLYQRVYAEAGRDEIASQFGAGFADAVFAEETGAWAGPIRSDHGWHLVNLRASRAAQVPPLEQIANRVREDALADKRALAVAGAIDALMERYTVEIDDELAP